MNGSSQLGGWVIAMVGGRCFIGQRKAGTYSTDLGADPVSHVRLQPVYELSRGLVQDPQGQVAIQNAVMPVLLLGGVERLDLPEAATVIIPFTDLSDDERAAMMGGVKSAESMRDQMRAASAGVVLAGPGAKLPPMPGRR